MECRKSKMRPQMMVAYGHIRHASARVLAIKIMCKFIEEVLSSGNYLVRASKEINSTHRIADLTNAAISNDKVGDTEDFDSEELLPIDIKWSSLFSSFVEGNPESDIGVISTKSNLLL